MRTIVAALTLTGLLTLAGASAALAADPLTGAAERIAAGQQRFEQGMQAGLERLCNGPIPEITAGPHCFGG